MSRNHPTQRCGAPSPSAWAWAWAWIAGTGITDIPSAYFTDNAKITSDATLTEHMHRKTKSFGNAKGSPERANALSIHRISLHIRSGDGTGLGLATAFKMSSSDEDSEVAGGFGGGAVGNAGRWEDSASLPLSSAENRRQRPPPIEQSGEDWDQPLMQRWAEIGPFQVMMVIMLLLLMTMNGTIGQTDQNRKFVAAKK
jgi:hypothetical protein